MKFNLTGRATAQSIPVNLLSKKEFSDRRGTASKENATWVGANGFTASAGQICPVPAAGGGVAEILYGLGETSAEEAGLWDFAALPGALAEGRYTIANAVAGSVATQIALGWALAQYRFDRYKQMDRPNAELVWPKGADRAYVEAVATGIFLTRDLINTPGADLTPSALAERAKDLAKGFGAKCSVIVGDALLKRNYPSIHAVGRAAADEPRLIDIRWGKASDPKITLVGKGVTFDSGGLDLKAAAGMLLMKKDMGGAGQVLGLASAIMALKLPICLRVLVPAVENAVSGNAMRPLDVLNTRKGLTVEVGNTDAEGRLILSDALAEADRENPEMILDFATLTGAARVALGTDLPALFCNDDDLAAALLDHGTKMVDPFWRLPLWPGYKSMLASKVADLSSTGSAPQGGAITAALFLEHFVSESTPWAHIDLMAWNNKDRPGRPEGGEAMGIRACLSMLTSLYG